MTPISLSGTQFPRPASPHNNIPTVFAADDNYVPFLGICMQSIAETGNPDFTYDFIVLETKITPDSKHKLARNLAKFKNISLRFFNPHEMIKNVNFHTPSYYSEETYYRLFLQTIFQHYDKLLYIDADTIITHDLAELYETDVTGYLFAATLNAGTIPLVVQNLKLNGYNWNDYLKKDLGLKDPYYYFQAGVLVANVDEIKKFDLQAKAIDKLKTLNPILVDQDILNSLCQGRIRQLSLKWNFMDVFPQECRNSDRIDALKHEDCADYRGAEEKPFVVHYAGAGSRPWFRPCIRYADLWWNIARRGVFYEDILFKSITRKIAEEHESARPPLSAAGLPRTLQRLTYWRYKALAVVTFGGRRERYLQKRRNLKQQLRKMC
jgi:lipopolysaccharide biosynthesis glycosyltransferase